MSKTAKRGGATPKREGATRENQEGDFKETWERVKDQWKRWRMVREDQERWKLKEIERKSGK